MRFGKLSFFILLATALSPLIPPVANAAPTDGLWNRDNKGVNGPILPLETYTNKKTMHVTGYVSMTCPLGTGQFSTASAAGADYEVKANATSCPTGDVVDGSAGTPRPNARTWQPIISYLGFCGVSGTTVYLSCWSYKGN